MKGILNVTLLINLLSWLGKMAKSIFTFLFFSFLFLFLLFLFFFFLFLSKDWICRIVEWIGVCGTLQIKVNSGRYISSIQKLNENSIKFSLLTQIRRVFKLSRLSYYNEASFFLAGLPIWYNAMGLQTWIYWFSSDGLSGIVTLCVITQPKQLSHYLYFFSFLFHLINNQWTRKRK